MPFALIQQFNGGEVSPLVALRDDQDFYRASCRRLRNQIPLPHGPAIRRPGTLYAAETADMSLTARVLPFVFNDEQAYVLEFGDETLRFFKDRAQIVVNDIGAAITNGTFDDDLSGWTDRSTGSAEIAHGYAGADVIEGTLQFGGAGITTLGDSVAGARQGGFRFRNHQAGIVSSVTWEAMAVATAYSAIVLILTDSGGSPGTQVGGDSGSVNVNSPGEKTFTWSSNAPELEADTDYWVVLSDVTGGGTGQVDWSRCVYQGTDFQYGNADTIVALTETSTSVAWRVEIVLTPTAAGVMELVGAAGDEARGQQAVANDAADAGLDYLLSFRVRGAASDTVVFDAGTTVTTDSSVTAPDIVNGYTAGPGWHVVDISYPIIESRSIEFVNDLAKTITIDDVALLDDQPLELGTPWPATALSGLYVFQSQDTMFLCHEDYPTYVLKRFGDNEWALELWSFTDGPWLPQNTSAVTLAPSATTGLGITITASASLWSREDVGRLVRILHSTTWGVAIVTGFTSQTVVTADVLTDFGASTAVDEWRLGAYGDRVSAPRGANDDERRALGFPRCGTLFQERLWLAGAPGDPARADASVTGGFRSFDPGDASDADAIETAAGGNTVAAIRWLAPAGVLFAGALGAVYRFSGETQNEPVTPSNAGAKVAVSYPAEAVQSLGAGDGAILFVQNLAKKLRELQFDAARDNYAAPEITVRGEHLLAPGIAELAMQTTPWPLVWMLRNDGKLVSMTYLPEQNVAACALHTIAGGSADDDGAVVESICAIPGDGADELWMVVRRTIDGGTARHVEYLAGFPGHDTALEDMDFLDAAVRGTPGSATIAGLGHLEGETPTVLGDGVDYTGSAVSSGSTTISTSVAKAVAGLNFVSDIEPLWPADTGTRRGTPQGRLKRRAELMPVLYRTSDFKYGPSASKLIAREVGALTDDPFALELPFPGQWDRDARLLIRQDRPLPLTVLGFAEKIESGGG